MIDYIEKAKAFAMMAHKGQTDKAGEDYFTAHVAVVADGVEPDPLVKAAAYLHDTVEDTGIVFGEAIKKAVGDKKGINRYGYFILPMDEVLALCAVDLSGRPYLNFECEFTVPKVGELDTELVKEFFYAVSYSAGMNLHIKMLSPGNNHHMIEAMFKAFAKALDQAVSYNPKVTGILSTKGSL